LEIHSRSKNKNYSPFLSQRDKGYNIVIKHPTVIKITPGNLGFPGDLGTPVFVFISLFSGTSSFTENLGTHVKSCTHCGSRSNSLLLDRLLKIIKYEKPHVQTSK
jgi:hypothetical protein